VTPITYFPAHLLTLTPSSIDPGLHYHFSLAW
jgi:hypothetical protein